MQQTQSTVKGMDCRNFINGQYVEESDDKKFLNINPASEEVIGWVSEATKEEVNQAVESAKSALKGVWATYTVKQRSQILRKIGDLILENVEEFAKLEALDTGKPYELAKEMDIKRAAHNFHFFADYVTALGNESYNQDNIALHYTVTRPVGVVAMINPWNLPLLLMTWKLAPCLAAGSTAVMKPAELTPMTATKLAEICKQAGVPDGVVNVVHGFGKDSTGQFLSEHPLVDAITFTGETHTGTIIMKAAAPTLKKVSFELGGKNPAIIFADANLDEVVETTLQSSFLNQGQVCLCASRIYVERSVMDAFLEKFVARTNELVVGDPFDAKTNIGSVVGKEHYEKVMSYIDIAKEEGGVILTGGKRPEHMQKGYFIEPTIIIGLTENSRCVKEEIFGPVVTVLPFDSEQEVLGYANDTKYGLGATIWTNDLRRAHRVAGQIEAGIVWVNTWYLRDLRTPFGGMKQSGIGREGGAHSFEFYCEQSNVTIKL